MKKNENPEALVHSGDFLVSAKIPEATTLDQGTVYEYRTVAFIPTQTVTMAERSIQQDFHES